MKKKTLIYVVLCAGSVLAPLLTGCSNSSPDIPKASFKRGEMPPEAQKGMSDAMKRAGAPPTGH